MLKTVGVLTAGIIGVGVMSKVQKNSKSENILKRIDDAREKKLKSERFPFLEIGLSIALETEITLDDLADRIIPYMQFDEEVAKAFIETCGQAAEFLLRKDQIQHKRSIPSLFRPFTSIMRIRLRELRRAVRDKAPGMLEEFDEMVQDVETFAKDSHHNMWCEAHKE